MADAQSISELRQTVNDAWNLGSKGYAPEGLVRIQQALESAENRAERGFMGYDAELTAEYRRAREEYERRFGCRMLDRP